MKVLSDYTRLENLPRSRLRIVLNQEPSLRKSMSILPENLMLDPLEIIDKQNNIIQIQLSLIHI